MNTHEGVCPIELTGIYFQITLHTTDSPILTKNPANAVAPMEHVLYPTGVNCRDLLNSLIPAPPSPIPPTAHLAYRLSCTVPKCSSSFKMVTGSPLHTLSKSVKRSGLGCEWHITRCMVYISLHSVLQRTILTWS